MLVSELITEIKWEAKLQQDSTWDAHLLLLIWDEMVSFASLQNETSLYVLRTKLTVANQDVNNLILLPAMVKLDRLEYEVPGSPVQSWFLPDRDALVPPVPISGRPRAYEICQGGVGAPGQFKIGLVPGQGLNSDVIYCSYWAYPAVPLSSDTLNPISWIQGLKVNCIRRAQIFNASSADLRAQLFASLQEKAEAVTRFSNKDLEETRDDKNTNQG